MNNNDRLSRENTVNDELLNSAAQQAMRDVVRNIPDDSLSMAWRSSLNEKLLAEVAVQKKRQRFNWYLRPALGLGLACTLAVLVVFRPAPTVKRGPSLAPVSQPGIEAALVTTHRQSTVAWDVAGVGLNPVEMSTDSDSVPVRSSGSSSGWSEDDLESL